MTERERLLEKIRKVQALANRGADGEKQSAAALLDKLMKQYGIDEAEIAEERLEIFSALPPGWLAGSPPSCC